MKKFQVKFIIDFKGEESTSEIFVEAKTKKEAEKAATDLLKSRMVDVEIKEVEVIEGDFEATRPE